jgi:hypothetical protein
MDQDDNKPKESSDTPSASEPTAQDVVLIHGRSPDGKGLAVLRHRENRLEHGLIAPMEHGKPIHGEVVRLKPRPEFPLLCDVQVEYKPDELRPALPQDKSAATRGPGQVATEQYRANWDRIFQSHVPGSDELN